MCVGIQWMKNEIAFCQWAKKYLHMFELNSEMYLKYLLMYELSMYVEKKMVVCTFTYIYIYVEKWWQKDTKLTIWKL